LFLAPDVASPRRCVKYAYDHVGELRVIFIKSAGRIWCAGGDPKDFQAAQKMESEGRAADNSAGAQEFARRGAGLESSTRLQCERTRPFRRTLFSCSWSARRERSIRPSIGRIDVDVTELERLEVWME
jgi:hypothetical protein